MFYHVLSCFTCLKKKHFGARPSGEGRRKKQSASGSDWSAGRVEDLFQNISSNIINPLILYIFIVIISVVIGCNRFDPKKARDV